MATIVLTRQGATRLNPVMNARPIGTLDTTETATWAEVTGSMLDAGNQSIPFAIPTGGCIMDVTVTAATRLWVGTVAPPAGVTGWLLTANSSFTSFVDSGDRFWLRTA
jgi:hypothetical protein